MNTQDKVAVCSRSFSRHPILREELLRLYKNVSFNDEGLKLAGDSLVSFLEGHAKAITALEVVSDDILSRLPDLKVLSKYGVGTDMIDFAALKNHGVSFGWEPGVNRRSVSELVLSFMIAALRHVPMALEDVRDGKWRQVTGRQLSGKTVGIIGCGNVGKDLVKLLAPFKCEILVHDIVDYASFYEDHHITALGLEELLARADIVTLHIPLDSSTRGMMSRDTLSGMKQGAILINTARGEIVDEEALKEALKEGKLSAAAFDVFAVEPPEDKELLALQNLLVTPHIGGSSEEAILAMGRAAIRGLDHHDQH